MHLSIVTTAHNRSNNHTGRARTARASLIASTLAALLASGCIDRPLAVQDPVGEPVAPNTFDLGQNRDLDLLFVIDNSNSMAAEQRSLVDNFSNFVARLEQIDGGLPNVHIGIVSTDMGVGVGNGTGTTCTAEGDAGRLWRIASPSCQAALPGQPFIIDIENRDGTRSRNYPDGQSLTDTFSCMAEIGTTGCGYEQPLESMRRALDPDNLANSGFLRDNAYLAVVFITDEDDCSAALDQSLFGAEQDAYDLENNRLRSFRCFEQAVICDGDDPETEGVKTNCRPRDDSPYMEAVSEYANFLKNLKGDANKVIVAGITGDPNPVEVYRESDMLTLKKSCGETGLPYSGAVPATRLDAFLDQFDYSTKTSLCNEDLSEALDDIAVLLAAVFDHRCLTGDLADTDPQTEGVQPECAVIEIRYPDSELPQAYVLPRCDGDPTTATESCYVMEVEPACSDYSSSLEIKVYPEDREVPEGTLLELQCVAE